MPNWIVWNRIDYLQKMDLVLNNLQRLICHKAQPTNFLKKMSFNKNFIKVNVIINSCKFNLIFLQLFLKIYHKTLKEKSMYTDIVLEKNVKFY